MQTAQLAGAAYYLASSSAAGVRVTEGAVASLATWAARAVTAGILGHLAPGVAPKRANRKFPGPGRGSPPISPL